MHVFSTSLEGVYTDSESYFRAGHPVFSWADLCFIIGNTKDYSDNCHIKK